MALASMSFGFRMSAFSIKPSSFLPMNTAPLASPTERPAVAFKYPYTQAVCMVSAGPPRTLRASTHFVHALAPTSSAYPEKAGIADIAHRAIVAIDVRQIITPLSGHQRPPSEFESP